MLARISHFSSFPDGRASAFHLRMLPLNAKLKGKSVVAKINKTLARTSILIA
jgi:hypothetical protein